MEGLFRGGLTWLALVAAVVAGGCNDSDAVSPATLAGTYVLERINGDVLPAVLYDDGTLRVVVLADTIRLGENDRGVQVVDATLVFPDLEQTLRWETAFSYGVAGGQVAFSYDCPPGSECAPPPHRRGSRTPGGLLFDGIEGEPTHQYRRVTQP